MNQFTLIAAAVLAVVGTFIELNVLLRVKFIREALFRRPSLSIVSSLTINWLLAQAFGVSSTTVMLGAFGSVILSRVCYAFGIGKLIVRYQLRKELNNV